MGCAIDLGREIGVAKDVIAHAPSRVVDGCRSDEFAIRIQRIYVIAVCQVGDVEALPGQPFAQKSGAPGVLATRFVPDPVFEFSSGLRVGSEQAGEGLQVDTLVL